VLGGKLLQSDLNYGGVIIAFRKIVLQIPQITIATNGSC